MKQSIIQQSTGYSFSSVGSAVLRVEKRIHLSSSAELTAQLRWLAGWLDGWLDLTRGSKKNMDQSRGNSLKEREAMHFDDVPNHSSECLRDLQELAETLKEAAPQLLDQRKTTYNNTRVLTISWERGEYEEMMQNAQKIGSVFADVYGFDVVPVHLPSVMKIPKLNLARSYSPSNQSWAKNKRRISSLSTVVVPESGRVISGLFGNRTKIHLHTWTGVSCGGI